jgi:hypothetical protein
MVPIWRGSYGEHANAFCSSRSTINQLPAAGPAFLKPGSGRSQSVDYEDQQNDEQKFEAGRADRLLNRTTERNPADNAPSRPGGEDALLRAGVLHYRGDRRVAGIWRDCFGGRGNRQDLVLRFPGALYRDPDWSCLTRQDGLGARERVRNPPLP